MSKFALSAPCCKEIQNFGISWEVNVPFCFVHTRDPIQISDPRWLRGRTYNSVIGSSSVSPSFSHSRSRVAYVCIGLIMCVNAQRSGSPVSRLVHIWFWQGRRVAGEGLYVCVCLRARSAHELCNSLQMTTWGMEAFGVVSVPSDSIREHGTN